jgi:hypothetical protein
MATLLCPSRREKSDTLPSMSLQGRAGQGVEGLGRGVATEKQCHGMTWFTELRCKALAAAT